jgi:pimeloyl-ACP methyl ester carboxylesterase
MPKASIHNHPVRRTPLLKRLSVFAAALLTAYAALCIVGGVLLMEGALHQHRRPVTGRGEFAGMVERWSAADVEDVSVAGADDATLKAWYVRPQGWNHDSVILLHGVGDNRQGVIAYVPMFLAAGYAVLLPDSRGHGESGGELTTYGLLEAEDVHRWALWLTSHEVSALSKSPANCIYLFGESLGAAIALQATVTARSVCAVVAEAPFESFREIGYERIAQGLGWSVGTAHIAAWPMVESAFLEARWRYGLDFDKASPERALAASRVPALLIVGLSDTNIPPRHGRAILQAAGPPSEIWEIPRAGHTGAVSVDSAAFEQRVLDWFAKHRGRVPSR